MVIRLKMFALACAAAIAAACAGPSNAFRNNINAQIARGDFEGALKQVDNSKQKEYSKKNAVLYYLDRAALLYDLERYNESDSSFAEADKLMDELFARSISRGIGTVLLNDNTTEYGGEIFERAIMHTYRAMNFMMSGQKDEALVEARRVTSFLSRYSAFMKGKSGYRDSPFAQYLSAMLFEEAGQPDDARIAYNAFKNASAGDYSYLKTMRQPELSASSSKNNNSNSRRKSANRGRRRHQNEINNSFDELFSESESKSGSDLNSSFDELFSESEGSPNAENKKTAVSAKAVSANRNAHAVSGPYSNGFDVPEYSKLGRDLGEIVLVHYNGPAPMKVSKTVQVAWNKAQAIVSSSGEHDERYENAIRAGFMGRAITVAYPEYVQRPYSITASRLESENAQADSILMEDITSAARTTLESKNSAIWARAVARATIKFVIANSIGQAGSRAIEKNIDGTAGQVLGLLFKAATHTAAAATEIADTRGWVTLPAQIRMARMTETPGIHNVKVLFLNGAGGVIGSKVFENVEVKAGQRTYLHCRTAL